MTDPCAQVGCCHVYPAWVTTLSFGQSHKTLGRFSAAPGPCVHPCPPRCPSCPKVAGAGTVAVRAGGAALGAGRGLCPSGSESELCPSIAAASPVPNAKPGWRCCSRPARACPALSACLRLCRVGKLSPQREQSSLPTPGAAWGLWKEVTDSCSPPALDMVIKAFISSLPPLEQRAFPF